MRIVLFLAFLLFVTEYALAQPVAGYGCLSSGSGNPSPIVNNAVYQTQTNIYNSRPAFRTWSTNYSNRTTDVISYPCWTWTTVTTNGCYLRRQNGKTNTASNYVLGNYGYFTGQNGTNCDFDTYVWVLLSGTMLFAVKRLSIFKTA